MASLRPPRAGGLCLLIGSLLATCWQQNFVSGGLVCRQVKVAQHAAAATTQEEADSFDRKELAKKAAMDAVEKAAKEVPASTAAIGKFWVNSPGQVSFEVEFEKGDTARELRLVIEKVLGIPVDKQELRVQNRQLVNNNLRLDVIDLSDVWVIDDRDDSPERGEYNPDPEEDMSLFANPVKLGTWILVAFSVLFVGTQYLEINPFANFPEGPYTDWSLLPEDERPGGKFFQRPDPSRQALFRPRGVRSANPVEILSATAQLKPGEYLVESLQPGKPAVTNFNAKP